MAEVYDEHFFALPAWFKQANKPFSWYIPLLAQIQDVMKLSIFSFLSCPQTNK
jgi:hypothetical protein